MHKPKERKLMERLSNFVASRHNEIIQDKKDICKSKQEFIFDPLNDFRYFKESTKNFTEDQWQILIAKSNTKITEKLKQKQKEQSALTNLRALIQQDDLLKLHNVSIVELVKEDNYFVSKVYLISGAYFIEGTITEIFNQIRQIVKEEKIQVRIFCPACSSKELRFSGHFCLCNDCGSLSIPDQNKIVKKYKLKDKDFWWAKALVDMYMFEGSS